MTYTNKLHTIVFNIIRQTTNTKIIYTYLQEERLSLIPDLLSTILIWIEIIKNTHIKIPQLTTIRD